MDSCEPMWNDRVDGGLTPLSTLSYYQKVPAEMPEMEHHQVYGLATPEDFVLPPHHPLWAEETYTAFQFSAGASEKYDTKVSGVPGVVLFMIMSLMPLCRLQLVRKILDQFQSQTLHLVNCLSLKPNLAAPYHELDISSRVVCVSM